MKNASGVVMRASNGYRGRTQLTEHTVDQAFEAVTVDQVDGPSNSNDALRLMHTHCAWLTLSAGDTCPKSSRVATPPRRVNDKVEPSKLRHMPYTARLETP